MKRLIGYMAALCLLALMVGCGGVTSTGTLAYVSNSSGTGFTVFKVNTDATLTKSSISPQNTPTPTNAGPKVLQFSANGKWAYFLDNSGAHLYGYLRAGNGTLTTQIGVFPVNGASAMVISPNSTFLYVALPGSERLAIYAIDGGTGNLTQQGSSILTSFPITQMVMAPGGGILYGLSPSKGQVLSYTLNPSSGLPTQAGVQPVGIAPTYMVLSANGAYMYVLSLDTTDFPIPVPPVNDPNPPPSCGVTPPATLKTPNIYGFNLSVTGGFTTMGPAFNENQDLVTGCFPAAPIAGVTSNDTRFLFVANKGTHNISSFRITSNTGELNEVLNSSTTVNGVTVTTGSPLDCGEGCTTPAFLAVSKANNGLYLLDPGIQGQPGKIFQFKINQNNGTLRAQNPASVPAEGNPTWITIR